MNSPLKYLSLLLLLLTAQRALALTKPPKLQRACLDKTTGIVTLYLTPSTDLCGSFTKYMVFGRDNGSDPFGYLADNATLASTQIAVPLPNNKTWELYVAALYACNGTDTLFSDTIFIDNSPPAYLEPDSVSVDGPTQRIIAGWPKAPEPDVMGYSIFKVDPVNGNNFLLDEQNVLSYSFTKVQLDPSKPDNRIALAAYDSCKNGGVISAYHSPVFLSENTTQNTDYQCNKKFYINWTAYKGWSTSSYDIVVSSDSGLSWKLETSVTGSTLSYIFSIPVLGKNYAFYIRAHKNASTITSSSNIIHFKASDFIKPNTLQLGHVSVFSSNQLEITGIITSTTSIKNIVLQKRNYGTKQWVTRATYSNTITNFRFYDNNLDLSTQKHQYRLVVTNSCGYVYDSSEIHTSILLRRSGLNSYWNSYWAWPSAFFESNFQETTKPVSTWNTINTSFTDTFYIHTDTSKALCYRVQYFKYNTGNNITDTAYSNTICFNVFDTTLVPNSFSPGGINPVFKIINPNVASGQAILKVYDRWGGKLFEGDALVGWDGTDSKGDFLGPGFYPYLIEIKRIEKNKVFKGTVSILR